MEFINYEDIVIKYFVCVLEYLYLGYPACKAHLSGTCVACLTVYYLI
jgi:hypothetical protein